MLQALELENFKAFGSKTRIEFAPITLIFGENSAGKSSILQSLSLLKQTRESREHGALLLPRSETGIVDLGSFQELLFDHDLSRTLVIRLEMNPQRRLWRSLGLQNHSEESTIGVELGFVRRNEREEVSLSHLQLYANKSDTPIARFELQDLTKEQRRELFRDSFYSPIHARRPLRTSELRVAKCVFVTTEEKYWQALYEESKRLLPRLLEGFERTLKVRGENPDQLSLFGESEAEYKDHLAGIQAAEAFYRSDFSLRQFVERMMTGELESLIALDGFISQPLRQRGGSQIPESLILREHGVSRVIRDRLSLDVGLIAAEAGRLVESMLESLYPMGPYRRPPERWYIFTGTNPQDVGYRGDLLPSLLYRRPEVVTETNEWLEKLQIGYRLDVRPIGKRTRDLFEVRLVDTRRSKEVDVALSDVGFGISQVLPFVVQALASERQIITIEQPEVHIHPRLQADLGDLLAKAIAEPRFHRFIVETHSEHLVLRMQKLVRSGTLKPEQVSIIYVSRGSDGAKAERLRLGEDGDFLDEWPGGFFPERLRELL